MRRFHSYGPVDCEEHFCIQRKELIDCCFKQLIGNPEKGGHYFTIWSPRQCGKTWLMRQVKKEIEKQYPEKFIIGMMSVQGVVMKNDDPEEGFLERLPLLFWESFKIEMDKTPINFEGFKNLFLKDKGLFSKPLILFIDEFDSLPPRIIDQLVTLFRDMYLKREDYNIHGLALIGVRAVLGVDSLRGSPFNIQRSLHVPNFTTEEVEDLFNQYQTESGQEIESEVVKTVYDSTRGQPGLVCWFGELLAETYNPGTGRIIDISVWKDVYAAALHKEWNNTVLNLIKKAQGNYADYVLELFTKSDLPFSIRAEWCSYLYLNGIIDSLESGDSSGSRTYVCRFSSPFVQTCLYEAFTMDFAGDRLPILALDPLDTLSDVFEPPELNIPALLERYKAYLKRLKAKGINPWKDQPRRADLHYTEYVGHFHLYFWLQNAVGRLCSVSPEFPTGNGRVDLHLRCKNRQAVIEVKSFKDQAELEYSRHQALKYAQKLELSSISLAVFVPVEDEEILKKLSISQTIEGVKLDVTAIGWV
ncbi:AAA ATPase-like domain-containing protein [Desulfonema limicola]|uniref:AAA ATPase-like domain-containing protein n=1 Tax=Desulfonema limicola TaxID=45656 RepID=A0A975GHL3_9BACT|nr:AAA-like domain-containing protein [Desulfonema limicola]QTA81434.1 AAA ATPase-like domain-containing protein [Desulfonema limicola]